MELLYEHARPEPRLRRLLGHVGIYETASRLCRERMQKSVFCLDRGEAKMVEDGIRPSRPVRASYTETQPVPTFSDFQPMIRSKLQHQQLCDVTTTEITEGSDGSDESEEIEASESGDDNHDDRLLSESEHSFIKRVEILEKASSLMDSDDLAREMSKCIITTGEQIDDEQIWGQQQRVLTPIESTQAFHNVWL
jgi:hypothetical protein